MTSLDARGRARPPRVTIREVADLAGVSIATASRALNDRGDVAEETRELVRRAALARGYRGTRTATRARRRRSGLVAVNLPLTQHGYFSPIMAGIVEALDERGLRLVLCPVQGRSEATTLARTLGESADGALLVLPRESGAELRALLEIGRPFVVIDPLVPLDKDIPAVTAANSHGAHQAVRHLLELGHRRIAAVTGPGGWLATTERLAGYHAALASAGLMPAPELVVEGDFRVEGGRAAGAALLDLPEPPTAIFAFNDMLAIGIVQAARARGVRVPEQLSLVGFDDVGEATIVSPALTTVRQPLAEMGRMAVSLLERLLEEQPIETLAVELGTRLVVRESAAAL